MTTAGNPIPAASPTSQFVAADQPIMVYSCSRLGRVANPPSFSLAGWLRTGRRR
ncbi:hypothetical protein [Mycolicibacterium smegmatis]|uniref:Uncharacterized protein n=3 Tax=Mycolicibacterium smegmatis TaxID=1772 RepID=I7FI75_MYCS2|nr:hypothetical protein [Mycolicibacterium smegmatis]ABK70311.1 hypothetical protein MSMEG_4751 [Mycolicibacterium smegmatis MC2 155]AFP41080.1 hypothetical protein MSMEI_4631 [Mycolicibacterium smegmatis MC2 155]AIU09803.1 hypothetical protein LJ00_23505 [Mycolicibacterium smegmatis MC2 155]AIU16428.1 hypothetical protein LI99_23510 [Mycolicibacterium smegmatis]AIU23051.1 hypothetical protein LI98_23515 [Mycolicibacterium smegmatis]